ncbi:hypothetical protein L1987_10993 [Smallanthus sonchifolius]|uniref:Uncharacterized protein n=1 Tax=Smallanthus sonchifolius TaxID=185202 RepID=A0ACB9JAJ4_9ASTR|nr:hypothetical protein L1987_10993 [Smallanthus sonchifolius]
MKECVQEDRPVDDVVLVQDEEIHDERVHEEEIRVEHVQEEEICVERVQDECPVDNKRRKRKLRRMYLPPTKQFC